MSDAVNGAATLHALGWDDRLAAALAADAPGLVPGRILAEERGMYSVASADGEHPASPSGRLRHDSELDPTAAWPAVGDWVGLEPLSGSNGAGDHRLVQRVLPRKSAVIRRAPGDRERTAQVLAANVDVVFVVTSANAEFNVRRLERYMSSRTVFAGIAVIFVLMAILYVNLSERLGGGIMAEVGLREPSPFG